MVNFGNMTLNFIKLAGSINNQYIIIVTETLIHE